jgi:integrase
MKDAGFARQRDVRTNLRFVARRAAPRLQPPEPLPLPRSRAKLPYSDAEIDAYLGLADAQPTEGRRMRLSALICLGAGAGCSGPDLRHVRGGDVTFVDGGMVVAVAGPRPRVVPVLTRFQRRLEQAAGYAGGGYVIGGRVPQRHNLTDRLVATAAGGIDLPRLEPARLRVTWLAVQATNLGLPALFSAAGFQWSKQLGDIVAALAPPSPAETIRLLGASR